jgi:hypothetical protein
MAMYSAFDGFAEERISRASRARTDPLEENLMQRRLHKLEPLHNRTRVYQSMQQLLWICIFGELDFEESVRIIHTLHELVVG